ncbi:uncharacterized protein LOC129581466 [Paramacrobiotus metropolitanus]|uniref:uncharacterized protein LOC129581466 n=1 Tax=Paramacrobiotus metropolitanus TaxID=2943436 RepID=UPI002446144B|nr:uncharacterized protein LOC129581466 [Paramacrobiotus metropolitanus]
MDGVQGPAVRSFAAGDVVLRCEPLVWVLKSHAYETRCAYCLRKSQKLSICADCKLHSYCNRACQRADWKLEHKLECELLMTTSGNDMAALRDCGPLGIGSEYSLDMPRLLIAKLVNKIKSNKMITVPGMDPQSVKDFVLTLPADPKQSTIASNLSPTKFVSESSKSIKIPAADFLAYYGLVNYNALPIYDALLMVSQPIGLAVYPVTPRHMTLVCWDMNALLHYHGRQLVIHAAEDIPQYSGLQDLRYNAFQEPFRLARAERRAEFEQRHGYPCTCRRCTPEYEAEINPLRCVTSGCTNSIPSDDRAMQACVECGAINADRLRQFREFLQQHDRIVASFPEDRNRPMLNQLCEKMDAAGIIQSDAHIRFVCGRELPHKYFDENRLEEGVQMVKDLMRCVRKIYPAYGVFRARLLMCAGLNVVTPLYKRMLDSGLNKLPPPAISQLKASAATVWALNTDYCSEAWSILVKLFGAQSQEVQEGNEVYKQAVAQLAHIQQTLDGLK